MKFRTEYKPTRSTLTLDPTRPIVLVGSCFAANIAAKMRECMWEAFNGVGTLYNPMSIAKVLELMIFGEDYSKKLEASLFDSEGRVHSWLFDSHFSALSREGCLQIIDESRVELLNALSRAQALIVTFGTSWIYSLQGGIIDTDIAQKQVDEYVVANCHKMPAAIFNRRRVSVDEITHIWIPLCHRIKQIYPHLTIIFTVSPVRHLKDGFEGNTLSKATLHLAIDKICNNVPGVIYFPAYELLCDDLRDYRFYASDLVHPSDMAVEYIWEVFCNTFIDDKGMIRLKEGNREYKRLNHRPIQKN